MMKTAPEDIKTRVERKSRPPVDVGRFYNYSPNCCRPRKHPASSSRSTLFDDTHDDLILTTWGRSGCASTGVLVLTGHLSYTGDNYSISQTARLQDAFSEFLAPVFQGLKGAEYAQTRPI